MKQRANMIPIESLQWRVYKTREVRECTPLLKDG